MHLGCEQASSVGRHPAVATHAFSRSMDLRIKVADLRGVQESRLLPLYFRAVESRRSKPVIVDQSAAELIRLINYDFWAPGIRLLRTWSYFDTPEVLAGPIWVWRHLPSLRKAAWVAHFAFVAENTPAAVAETPCDPGL